jgi:hypothetical protein
MNFPTCMYNYPMAYFALSIFLSAFLLFQVQPMIARIILPWFGGTSAVWSTVQMFFQVLLTGGYAYANWLVGKSRRREIVHIVLLGISVAVMLVFGLVWKSPITPDANWKPVQSGFPVWEICKILLVSVGLPYFLISTNSPLIQAWFHRKYPEKTAYRLYALSNVASFLGLVTYPVLIEPYLTLAWQGRLWSLMYLAYAGLAGFGVIKSLKHIRIPLSPNQSAPLGTSPGLTIRDYSLWIILAACASILLLATTSQITQEVAVIPFLWVLPLTIYLFSFILAFSGERWYSRQVYLVLFFVGSLLTGWALGRTDSLAITVQIGIYSFGLFVACMVCHGELYRIRPHPVHLTRYYLMVSVGGALGGIFINFLAPFVFKGYWELSLGYTLCWVLFLVITFVHQINTRKRWVFVTNSVLLLSMVLVSGVRSFQQIKSDVGNDLFLERNYYGVVRVRLLDAGNPLTQRYALVHGVTIHGYQFLSDLKRDIPTAYFGDTSGGGLSILNYPTRGSGMRVGILGLGIGTLASYGLPGDVYRFYEINPLVINLAEGKGGYFSYLSDCQAKVEIVPGDARLSLENELAMSGSQNYDVLVLDVFSSDSIPVHLLDAESFNLYLDHLRQDGILAVHISNRHLNLVPVVWTLADYFGLERILISDPGLAPDTFPSLWMLLAHDASLLAIPDLKAHATPMEGYVSPAMLWTDDYSNLFKILK